MRVPFCFNRDIPNPRRGFDKCPQNEVKRGRLGLRRSRNPKGIDKRSDVDVPSLSLLEKKWSPVRAPFFFIRKGSNPRRGFDKRLRNEVKRSRLGLRRSRNPKGIDKRSDVDVPSLSRREWKFPSLAENGSFPLSQRRGYEEPSIVVKGKLPSLVEKKTFSQRETPPFDFHGQFLHLDTNPIKTDPNRLQVYKRGCASGLF